MKVSVIADVQAHAYPAFSHLLPSGRNSRLQHALDTLEFAADQAEGGYLIVLGDLFEDRQRLGIDVLDAMTETMHRLARRLEGVFLVAGNHDQYFRDGSITSLRHFEGVENIRVVYESASEKLLGTWYHMCAFHHDPALVRGWIDHLARDTEAAWDTAAGSVLCIHQAMLGAVADGGFVYDKADALTVADVRPDVFKEVLVGHFHSPQSLAPNVHYVGSPYQIKMNEIGEQKRVAVLGEGGALEWVPVTCCPTFRRATAEEFAALLEEERGAHFWEVRGGMAEIPRNVRVAAEARPPVVYDSACADLEGAVAAWLAQRGRSDLLPRALELLAT